MRFEVALFGIAMAASAFSALAQNSGYAYITNQLGDSVSVIEIPSGNLIKNITVAPSPAPIALCGETAVVTSTDAHQITLINLKTLETQQMDFARGPFGVDCDAQTAYIGDWFTHQVFPLDLKTRTVLSPIAVGHSPAGVLLDKKSQRLYVANRDDDTLSIIDLRSQQIISTLATGDAPYGLAINPVKQQLYVINVRSSNVTVIDTDKLEVLAHWEVGEWPYCAIVNDKGDRLFVTNQEDATVSVIETSTGETLHTLEISEVPEGIDITQDQRYIVTVGWESGVIDIIDAKSLEVIQQPKAGKGSRSFGHFISSVKPLM